MLNYKQECKLVDSKKIVIFFFEKTRVCFNLNPCGYRLERIE
jgi:hypothetical protein